MLNIHSIILIYLMILVSDFAIVIAAIKVTIVVVIIEIIFGFIVDVNVS